MVINDGQTFKSNKLKNPGRLKLILYQDAFEITSPVGKKKQKKPHKILAVYLSLANFPAHVRSNADHMSLVRSAINKVLPDLAEVSKDTLEETLQSLDIETSDEFLEESDLIMALRPTQARKVLAAWKMRCKYSSILGCS